MDDSVTARMEKNTNGPNNLYNTVPWQSFHLCIPPIAPDARPYEDLVKDMAELRKDTTVKTAYPFRFVVRPYDEVTKDTAELREGSEILSIPHFGRSSDRTIAAQGEWPPVKAHFSTPICDNKQFAKSSGTEKGELIYTSASNDR